ncbi:hypothetical protein FS842_001369 [Serendipita sp. 407]|nr:hypothetical protein FS842_001369 [Serendipita sp. 407]
MPHRPSTNPIPRYSSNNVAQNSPQTASQLSGNLSEYNLSQQQEREPLPPRHRAVSWSSQPANGRERSKTNAGSSAASTPSNATGRSGGRALPPPRFQRKQRPPRVQQALATANSASGSTNSLQSQTRPRRANVHAPAAGTVAGPPGNWPSGSNAVISLSMAEVNAASARGSIIHHVDRQTATTAVQDTNSLLPPYITNTPAYDPTSGHSTLEFQNMDPVQLHNRITFGMGNQSVSSLFTSHAVEHFNSPMSSPGHFESGTYIPESSYQSLNIARLRSQSHSSAPHSSQLGSDMSTASSVLGGYSGVMSDEPLLRTRSRSLIMPAEIGAHPSQQSVSYPLPSTYATPTTPSIHTDDSHSVESRFALAPSASILSNALTATTSTKPLKSALKSRKTIPLLAAVSPSPGSPSLRTSASYTSEGYDVLYPPHSAKHDQLAGGNIDADFSLPDSLQAQYAEQLKLLQQEYTVKAAKAERSRQRSAERVKPTLGAARSSAMKGGPLTITISPSGSVPNEVIDVTREEEHVISHSVVDVPTKDAFQGNRHYMVPAVEGYDSWDEEWGSHLENHSTMRTGRSRALSDATSGGISGAEDDIGSDIGDRGHGDTERSYFPDDGGSRRIFSDSTRSRSLSSLVSHIASGVSAASSSPIASPSGAIYHGVDPPSPSTSSLISPVLSGIQVEVIAPTPLTQSKELDPEDPMTYVTLVNSPSDLGLDVMDSEAMDSSPSGPLASPRTSAESSGSSDSNNTIIRESITKLLAESPADLHSPPVMPAISSLSASTSHSSRNSAQIHTNSTSAPPQLNVRTSPGMSNALPTAQTVTTTSLHTFYSPAPIQNFVIPSTPYQTFASASEPHSAPIFTPVEHVSTQGTPLARRLSSMPSISSVTSSASVNRAGPTFSPSSNVRVPPHQRVDVLRPNSSFQDAASASSHTNSSSAFDDVNLSRSTFAQRSFFSNIDLSSSASVESGSSYGGNSGASHLSRHHEHSPLGPLVSHHSGNGTSDANPRGNIDNARRLPKSDLLPIFDVTSDSFAPGKRYGMEDDSLSARNIEPMDSASKGGTTGRIVPTGRAFGGDSIWTLGRDEEAQWPAIASHSDKRNEAATPDVSLQSFATRDSPPTGSSNVKSASLSSTVSLNNIPTVYPNPAVQRFEDPLFSALRPQHSSPSFVTPGSSTSGDVISVLLHPHELEQLKALRAAQVRGQITHSPLPSPLGSHKGNLSQVSTRSLPSMAPDSTSNKASVPGIPIHDRTSGLARSPASDFASRPSTAVTGRSSHSGESGESAGRRSIVALPASGGVFPRYQELTATSFESLPRPGSSRGRFKSLFRGRDSKVFK